MIDTHAHLDQKTFEGDLTEVLARAAGVGVERVITVGVTANSSRDCIELAQRHEMIDAAVGIQPNDVAEAGPQDWDTVTALATDPSVVALGETGLDRHWDHTPFDQQQDYFDRHLRLSQDTGLPFIVHMRECEEDILTMLREARERGPLCGVMHSFTGTADSAAECVELGLMISFAGMVTYKKSDELRAIAATVPASHLLAETDSPYLSPEPVRKIRRNEPAHVAHTLACLAEVQGVGVANLDRITSENARRLFKARG